MRCTYLFVCFMMICRFSANFIENSATQNTRQTLITIDFIYCLSILLALFKKKVVPHHFKKFSENSKLIIIKSGAIFDKVVSESEKVVPRKIRVKTLVIIGFIYYLFLLAAPLKKKVVPSLKANNINRLRALWHHFLTFCRRSFQQTSFRFLSS